MTTETIPHPLDRLRVRYPDGLICIHCQVILATRRESYAKSNLTEAARLSHVCAECRADEAAVAITAEHRAAAGRANLELARAALRVARNGGPGGVTETPHGLTPRARL